MKNQKNFEEVVTELLQELMIKFSALETILINKGIFSDKEMSESQISSMLKLKQHIEQLIQNVDEVDGFVKYGNPKE